jgi:hypothetical protein
MEDRMTPEERREYQERLRLSVFLGEIEMQCQFVLMGWDQLHDTYGALTTAMKTGHKEPWKLQSPVWFALQGIVVSAANLSKLLWGSGGKQTSARAHIRELIGVEDTSPLQDPDLRNDFEHFDERINKWFDEHPEGAGYAGRCIGVRGESFITPNYPDDKEFGFFDPKAAEVIFWSHSVALTALVSEVTRILPAIEAAKRKASGFDF